MVVLVRPADRGELAAVGRLTLDAYAADGHIVESDLYAAHLLDAAARATQGELLVGVIGDRLAGTVTFCPEDSAFAEVARPGEGEFRMLAVDPASRRQGVAEALVRACVARSRDLGYDTLVLSSLPVQVAAHRLYERLGFRRAPDRDWAPRPDIELLGFELPL